MPSLFEKLRGLLQSGKRPKSMRMFASIRTTQRWLDSLPDMSEYEMHHALVEGLERFNGDTRGDMVKRLKMLQVMEETGAPVQARIAADYIATPETNVLGRQTLWREAHLFWTQMATAYLEFLKLVLKGEGKTLLAPWRVDIILNNLRYASLAMRWEYFRGQKPSELAWRRLHRVYRMAEIAGEALSEVEVDEKLTSCAREYVLTLLFDLANPHVFQPREAQSILTILEGLETLPIPEVGMRRDRHSHMIDLSTSLGAESIAERRMPGKRLRYFEMRGVVGDLERSAASTTDVQTGLMCKQIARIIGRSGAKRDSARLPAAGEVQVALGLEAVVAVMHPGQPVGLEAWKLRDESRQGLGFILPTLRQVATGDVLVARRPRDDKHWHMLAVRWVREENGQCLVGSESISRHAKLVDMHWQDAAGQGRQSRALFLPLANTGGGVMSNLLLPGDCYEKGRAVSLRDEDVQYRLSLGQVVESHASWLRVQFDVLARETLEGRH